MAIFAERLQRRGHIVNLVSVPRGRSYLGKLKSLAKGQGWSRDLEPATIPL